MKYFGYFRKSTDDPKRQILSPAAQRDTIANIAAGLPNCELVEVLGESRTAKRPGRPVFNEMLDRVEAGEVEGIIAWAPNRLARNAVDAGRLLDLLDRGKLKDLKFSNFAFENNATGRFMLGIMFAESTHYSGALSEIIKSRSKLRVEAGWRPNSAPLGYVNHAATKTIRPHPVHFKLVRRVFDLMLSGAYPPRQIARIAREEWGFRTPRHSRSGGRLLALSSVHRMLRNPFYAGLIVWTGQTYPGLHKPVVTVEEFEQVARMLERRGRPQPQRYTFAFTGLMRCVCGLMVTAEHKVNRHGTRYVYYHCTRRALDPRCRQPSLELGELETQISAFLATLRLDEGLERWLRNTLEEAAELDRAQQSAQVRSQKADRAAVEKELRELTGLRIRSLIGDEEFLRERNRLERQRIGAEKQLQERPKADRFEPFKAIVKFSDLAVVWFSRGTDEEKRLVLETVGSNPVLADKKLSIQAAPPFVRVREMIEFLFVRSADDNIRTLSRKRRLAMVMELADVLADDIAAQRVALNVSLLEASAAKRARVTQPAIETCIQTSPMHAGIAPTSADRG